MGRAVRRPGPPSFLFGVWGQGETSDENIDALLSEFIEGLGEVAPRFLLPLDKEITTDTHLAVVEFADRNKYAVEVVQAVAPRTKALREVKELADKVHEAEGEDDDAISAAFIDALVAKGENARLLFLWADDAEDDQRVLEKVYDGGIACLDLTQGLDALAFGGDEAGDGAADDAAPDDSGDDADPDEETVREWSVRRIRTFAKEDAAARRKAKEKGVPTDDELDDLGKNELLAFLYPSDDEPEPEKPARSRRASKSTQAEPEPEKEEGVTPRRARQMREEGEAEGTDSSTRNRRRGAAAAAEQAKDGPEDGAEGEGTEETPSDALERLIGAIEVLGDSDASDDEVKDAVRDFADAFADHVIDRIAERVEKEPEDSPVRQEIAPKRPPGKPRKDGATPTRRRTRA